MLHASQFSFLAGNPNQSSRAKSATATNTGGFFSLKPPPSAKLSQAKAVTSNITTTTDLSIAAASTSVSVVQETECRGDAVDDVGDDEFGDDDFGDFVDAT